MEKEKMEGMDIQEIIVIDEGIDEEDDVVFTCCYGAIFPVTPE